MKTSMLAAMLVLGALLSIGLVQARPQYGGFGGYNQGGYGGYQDNTDFSVDYTSFDVDYSNSQSGYGGYNQGGYGGFY